MIRTRRERFLVVVPKRVNKILKALRTLANCGNTRTYQYKQNEVKKIFDAIEEELYITKLKFGSPPTRFTLTKVKDDETTHVSDAL